MDKIATLKPGQSGYCDPWCLVEGQRPHQARQPNIERGEEVPAPPDPRSGMFYLWHDGIVSAEPAEFRDMPVRADENGGLVVELPDGYKLANAPRLEPPSSIGDGTYAPCRVTGLQAALVPAPPVSAASLKADEEKRAAAAKDADASAKGKATAGGEVTTIADDDDQTEERTMTPIRKYFAFEHLPAHLQEVSRPIGELAQTMDEILPDGPEKTAGLRKLLEAKDCFVRAKLD